MRKNTVISRFLLRRDKRTGGSCVGEICLSSGSNSQSFPDPGQDPNVVIDRKHFEDTVWKDSIVTSDSLTQCIFEIRKILGDTKRKTLVTIPKVGYVLWADAEENSNVEPLFGREPARSRQHSPQYGQRIPGNDKSLDLPVSAKLISLR